MGERDSPRLLDLSPDPLLSLLGSDLLRLLLLLLLRPPPPLGDPVLLRDSGKPPAERERLREADPRSDILARNVEVSGKVEAFFSLKFD